MSIPLHDLPLGFSVMRLKWKNGCAGTGVTLPIARGMDAKPPAKVNGRWAYLYQAVGSRGPHCRFLSPPSQLVKLHTGFWVKSSSNVKKWRIPRFISTDKAPAYGRACSASNTKAGARLTLNTDRLKYRNNVIGYDHGKSWKRIIGATRRI